MIPTRQTECNLDRVVVSRAIVGICGMQVCAVEDATDEEILAHCNSHNIAGTEHGWTTVVRKIEKDSMFMIPINLPVNCAKYRRRLHFFVLC